MSLLEAKIWCSETELKSSKFLDCEEEGGSGRRNDAKNSYPYEYFTC